MSKINIRESLRNMDADSCCKYDLLTMYDACSLTDEDKADIAKLLFDNEDPEVIYQKLCTYFCDDDVSELTGLTDVQNVTPFEAIINNVKTGLDQKYDGVFYNDVAGQFEITSKDTTYTFGLSPVEYETDGISLYVDYNYDVPINYTSIKEASEDILNKCNEKVSTASQSNDYVDDDTMEYTVYDVVEDEGRLCAKCMNESTNSFEDIKLGKVNSDAVNELLNNILNNPNYKLTNDCRKKIADNSAPWGIVMSPGFDITASNALMSTGDFGGSVSFGESEELTFENGDRVTDGDRKGTVIDCDSIKVLVDWDYSETDDIEWVDKSELSFVECLKESEIPMDTVKKDIQSYLNHNLGSNEVYIEVNDVHNIDKDTVGVEYEVHLSIPIGNGEYERDTEYRSLPFRYKYGKWQPEVTESKYDIKTKTTARKLVDKAKADDIEWVMKEDLSFVNALKESENSPEVTYKQDRRLNSTSVIYKGYLIKIDRGGDGYNVYDKYRELEDTGFPSMEAAKKFVDELVTKDKMYESTTNTESYSTEQDLIDAGYKYVASNSPYDLYRKIVGGKGDWYAVNYENNTVQHITYAQARGYEPIDDTTGIKKLSMELGKKLLPQNESLGDTDCTESVHLGDVVEWHGTPHVVVNNDEDEDLLTLRPKDKFKDSDFSDDDEGDNSEDVYISPLQLKESVDDGWVKRWSFADKWYKGPFVISKNPEPYKGYHLEKVKPNGATAKHYGNFNSIDDAKAEASKYLKESADDDVNSNRFLPSMEYCPACGGTRFNVKTGVCADCGYDEGDWGYTGTDDLDEDAEGYVNLREAFEDTDELELKQAQQEFSSAATSINSNKLPAIYNMVEFRPGDVVVDFGGGKFDNAVNYLKDKNVTLLVYDPYNRSAEHNKEVLRLLKEHGGADAAVNSNVLNVIKEPEAREAVLKNIKKITKRGAPIYITVYEGRGDGAEGPTKSGYQLNRKTGDYMDEVGSVFSNVKRKGKLITAINESTKHIKSSRNETFQNDKRLSSTSTNVPETQMIDDLEYFYEVYPEAMEPILIRNGATPDKDNWLDGCNIPQAYNEAVAYFESKYDNDDEYSELDTGVGSRLGWSNYIRSGIYEELDSDDYVDDRRELASKSTEGYVYTYCDECGKKNRVKVTFNNFNEPFNDTEYKCKYCGANNLLTDPHSYDKNGNLVEASDDGGKVHTKSGYQLNRKTGDYMTESIVTDASNIGQGYAAPIMVSLVTKAKELEKLVKEYKNSKDKDSFERFLPSFEDNILDYKSEIEEKIKDFDKYWEVHKKAMLDNISEAVSILKNIGIPGLDSKLSKLNESYSDDEWIDRMWEAFRDISGIKDISEGKKPNTYIVTFDSEGSATARARILLKALIKADLDIELDSSNGSNVFTFITPTNEWEFIKGKMIKDSDGFLTSYDWYRNTDSGLNIFMFGAEEADPDYADWETESDAEAEDWFKSYNGFNDEEELDESVGSSGTTEVISKELKDAAYKLFKTPKWGFESDKEIEDYINPIFDVSENPKTGDIEVQVRAELGYDNLMDLSEVLDKVISKYDKDAYFEPEQPGILCAFIRY